ncbi:unnamed protein product, partial [marine sediment metagenome]
MKCAITTGPAVAPIGVSDEPARIPKLKLQKAKLFGIKLFKEIDNGRSKIVEGPADRKAVITVPTIINIKQSKKGVLIVFIMNILKFSIIGPKAPAIINNDKNHNIMDKWAESNILSLALINIRRIAINKMLKNSGFLVLVSNFITTSLDKPDFTIAIEKISSAIIIAGASTMIGDFPNIVISRYMNASFIDFLRYMGLPLLFLMVATTLMYRFYFPYLKNDKTKVQFF